MMIYDQYPFDLANRRMLIIDRLKRQVPGKNRAQLVSFCFISKKVFLCEK